jgi:GH15 family glucan-1,4-alpha-glucosidase
MMTYKPQIQPLDHLHSHSLDVIFSGQAKGGGYIACPHMPDYAFSWFRDGAFIAYALTLDGMTTPVQHPSGICSQWDSAGRFHNWCVRMVNARASRLEATIERAARGEPFTREDTLNARYQDEGIEGPEGWPEFQLDGPGLWLWALASYISVCRLAPLPVDWEAAIEVTARYLAAVWRTPCYDCWEERGTDIHTSTLAAIYTGLDAAERLLPRLNFQQVKQDIRAFILANGLTPSGELAKSVGLDMVDANLLLAALPDGGLFSPDDPLIQRTVARIERDLLAQNHGVHRHTEDTYYGGGAWVLLGLWLAWHYTQTGRSDEAATLLQWAEDHANANGDLPEQVNDVMFDASYYQPWVKERGEIARPLLWTHAKYIIVRRALGR